MLIIADIDTTEFLKSISNLNFQYKIATQMNESFAKYSYNSKEQLLFELNMRYFLVDFSKELNSSDFSFATFRNVRVNDAFWTKTTNGGMQLKSSVSSYDAICDILINSNKYATECATAMVIVHYLALTKMYTKEFFDSIFTNITLMNWHYLDKNLSSIGNIYTYPDYFYGDRRYFNNPDVNPKTPEWQGENVIYLDEDLYYGHGVGINSSEKIIASLNKARRTNATTSAYLMDSCSRPNYRKLYSIYDT